METEKPKSNNDFRSCLCKDITRSSESKQTHSYLQTGVAGFEGGAKVGCGDRWELSGRRCWLSLCCCHLNFISQGTSSSHDLHKNQDEEQEGEKNNPVIAELQDTILDIRECI